MPDTSDESLVFLFIPSLIAQLVAAQAKKETDLTEAEVLAIRDSAECVVSPLFAARQVEEVRGYPDVDPERCWEQWLEYNQ